MSRRLGPLLALALLGSLLSPVAATAQEGDVQLRAAVADMPPPRPAVEFHGSGWGHSVGMSQYGAYAQALSGRPAATILQTYYPGSGIATRDDTSSLATRVGLFQNVPSSTPIVARGGPLYWQLCNPTCEPLKGADGQPVVQRQDQTFRLGNVVPVEEPATTTSFSTSAEDARTWDGTAATVDDGGRPGAVVDDADRTAFGAAGFTAAAEPQKVFGLQFHDGTTLRIDPATHCPGSGSGADPCLRVQTPLGGSSWIEGPHPMKTDGSHAAYRDGFHEFFVTSTGGGTATLTLVHQVSSLERYLRGLAEVPLSWGEKGPASLEAQIIAARTYALKLIQGGWKTKTCKCHLLATPQNQVWIAGRHDGATYAKLWYDAIAATSGQLATYEGAPISTFYSSSHGGRTEAVQDSWAYGTTPIAYLRSVDDPWSVMSEANGTKVGNPYSAWTAQVSNTALAKYVGDLDIVTRVLVRSRTAGGSPAEVLVEGLDASGARVSKLFTRPTSTRKPIAGANFRLDLKTIENAGLRSQQIKRFGFAPFRDDDGNAHEYAIVFVTTAGIANGTSPTQFSPTGSVKRGQMATFLYQTLDLPDGQQTFSDVPSDHTHAKAISAVADAGIAHGFEDGTFRPNEPVTRAQMASFLAAAFDLPPAEDDGSFEDVPSGVHQPSIHAVAKAKITDGCEPGKYCPLAQVTRGQMASFLYRAVQYARGSSSS